MMRKFKVLQVVALVLMLTFVSQGCYLFTTQPQNLTAEEVKGKRVAEAVALHGVIGRKLRDSKQTIVNECQTNVLLTPDDCKNAKRYYNLAADLHHIATNMLKAGVDEANTQAYLDQALNDVLKLTGNDKYVGVGTVAVAEIIALIKEYPGLDPMTRTERVLRVVQNQVLNIAIQIVQKKIEEGGK